MRSLLLVSAILLIAVLSVAIAPLTPTGYFGTDPTIRDTQGHCIPDRETGCFVSDTPCCAPARCETQIGKLIVTNGVCKIPITTA